MYQHTQRCTASILFSQCVETRREVRLNLSDMINASGASHAITVILALHQVVVRSSDTYIPRRKIQASHTQPAEPTLAKLHCLVGLTGVQTSQSEVTHINCLTPTTSTHPCPTTHTLSTQKPQFTSTYYLSYHTLRIKAPPIPPCS